jgi:hypothetical protein
VILFAGKACSRVESMSEGLFWLYDRQWARLELMRKGLGKGQKIRDLFEKHKAF